MSTTRQLLRQATVVTKSSKGFTPMGGFSWKLKSKGRVREGNFKEDHAP